MRFTDRYPGDRHKDIRVCVWDAGGVRRLSSLLVVGVAVAAGCVCAAAAFFVLPDRLVDDARFRGARADSAVEQQRLTARHDVRMAGVQFIGALALIVGGALTWRTVWLTREGQITDRLARAVEQLGEVERCNVRVGAIYALGRVARDSRADHAEVMALLGEHLRSVRPAVGEDGRGLDLGGRRGVDPEVRAVASVLRGRRARWDPKEPRLNFSGIDFRNAPLQGVVLRRADLRRSNFRGAYLSDADLCGARLDGATLWGTNLQRCRLRRTSLTGADLRYAHAERACLRAAELDEAVWGATELQRADLREATGVDELRTSKLVSFDERTRWPRARSSWWSKGA
jgi:hypothetical protein